MDEEHNASGCALRDPWPLDAWSREIARKETKVKEKVQYVRRKREARRRGTHT